MRGLMENYRGFTKRILQNTSGQSSMLDDTHTKKEYADLFNMTVRDWLTLHHEKTRFNTMHWMGVTMIKNPLDAWILGEILYEVKPERIIEIGSLTGGTTLYLANLLDLIGSGLVISIDLDRERFVPKHKRITAITGDSHAQSTFEKTADLCEGKTVLVIHDADHHKKAVLEDLRAYSKLVTVGSYFIVEDGILDLFASTSLIGRSGAVKEGPLSAIEEFLLDNPHFQADRRWERYIITYNPRGYLRRIQ